MLVLYFVIDSVTSLGVASSSENTPEKLITVLLFTLKDPAVVYKQSQDQTDADVRKYIYTVQ